MHKSKYLMSLILILFMIGCSGKGTVEVQIPKYVVAADVRSDPVNNLTLEIEQALLKDYLSDQKVKRESKDFKKVVNSHKLSGGTVFLVRTKGGFLTYFVQDASNKILLVFGSESEVESNSPGDIGMSTIRDQLKDFGKVFIGNFNFSEATKISITWKDGHQTTHQLTNGTVILELKGNEQNPTNWELFDNSGKSLIKEIINY